jgi:hypothetical protein
MTVVDGDAAGREDRRAGGELGFVAGGRGLPATRSRRQHRGCRVEPGLCSRRWPGSNRSAPPSTAQAARSGSSSCPPRTGLPRNCTGVTDGVHGRTSVRHVIARRTMATPRTDTSGRLKLQDLAAPNTAPAGRAVMDLT